MRIGRLMDFKIVRAFDKHIEKIQAYPVLDVPNIGIQLMVHRRQQGRGWAVSEWTTGQRIDLPVATVTRRETAAQMAIDKVRTLPPGKLEALLADAPKVNKEVK